MATCSTVTPSAHLPAAARYSVPGRYSGLQTYGPVPLWPAEVWEGQLDIVIFALLLLFRTTKHARGQALCMYAMLYSVVRFFLEMLRGDYAEPWMFGLKSAQATSLGFFLVALGFFIYCGWLENINLFPKKKLSAKI